MKTKVPTLTKIKLETNFLKQMCYVFLLFSGIAFGQIVNIPDANFKQVLIGSACVDISGDNIPDVDVDSNNDSEIQLSEALAIQNLDVRFQNITDLTGVELFSNLISLNCNGNSISFLNISNLTNLQKLYCYNNLLTDLNTSTFLNLKELSCGANQLTSLNTSSLLNLTYLDCSSNNITILNLSPILNLTYLNCEQNPLTFLDISSLTLLTILRANYCNLNFINFSSSQNLLELYCNYNSFTSLNLTTCASLNKLECCFNSNLSSINLSGLNSLKFLKCDYNNLTSLDLNGCHSLIELKCSNNSLVSLDLSTCTSLEIIEGMSNLFSNLDFSNNPLTGQYSIGNMVYSESIYLYHNPNLISINFKNGSIAFNTIFANNSFEDCPNLKYVCVDNVLEYNQISPSLSTNTVINSYCSFTPGGNYNTITGQIKFDANNNGCDINDLPQPNIRLNINDGTNAGATFTNNLGIYNFYTQTGSFVLTPDTENPTWFTFSPATATIPFANNNNNTTTQNFCIAANGVHNDVEVVVEPIIFARPGFDAVYKVVYKNKGNQPLSGVVSFNYNNAILHFISATVFPTSQSTGVLNWSYTNLMPFENRSFYITFHVNAPTDTPPVNIGDVLSFNASITPMFTDENPLDNSFTYNQTVVGSFDPNNITCLEGAVVPPSSIGNYLHYGVNFENTGTYPAENIVVKVVVDTTKYDINSLQMLNTSHPAYSRITGNIVEFIFKNIMLDSGGHGNVLFKIKSLSTLVAGDMVSKRADIFFDYNAPVNTGMANTTFQLLNNGQFVLDSSIMVLPNPTSSLITINGTSNIKSVEVYDVQGRLLETKLSNDVESTINISDKTNGIYFLKINTEKGSKIEKIIKE